MDINFKKRELFSITKPLGYGKYKRKSLRIIARDDPKYFIWLYGTKPFVMFTKKVKDQYEELFKQCMITEYGTSDIEALDVYNGDSDEEEEFSQGLLLDLHF